MIMIFHKKWGPFKSYHPQMSSHFPLNTMIMRERVHLGIIVLLVSDVSISTWNRFTMSVSEVTVSGAKMERIWCTSWSFSLEFPVTWVLSWLVNRGPLPNVPTLRNKALFFGFINHRFPLIRYKHLAWKSLATIFHRLVYDVHHSSSKDSSSPTRNHLYGGLNLQWQVTPMSQKCMLKEKLYEDTFQKIGGSIPKTIENPSGSF